MVHSLLAAWRVSLYRTRADWPIVLAAALISLLAATLLAAGPIYSNAASEAGLHRVLADAAAVDANIEIVGRVTPGEAAAADERVRGVVRDVLAGPTADVWSAGSSDSFALPGQEGAVRDLIRLGYLQGLESRATLVDGAWPRQAAPSAALEVAVLEPVASILGLHIGDTLSLVSRVQANQVVESVVVAIYRPTNASDTFWWEDPELLAGVAESPNYRTFGPIFTTEADFFGRVAGERARVVWHAFPRIEEIRVTDLAGLTTRIEQLPGLAGNALPDSFVSSATGLPAILSLTERSLLASRTGVLLLLVQLAILAGYAITLTADLIVDHRRVDTALLRSRGASTLQVGVLALAEAVLLAAPCVLLAPWLAAFALRLFNIAGPMAAVGVTIEPLVTPDAYLAAAGAALGCVLLLVLPAFTAARSYAAERSGRARPGTRPLGQRLGLDIALLAVAAIGLWQLRLYGTPLTRSVQGILGIDPLLVAAPAIGILAGSVVALRIVPLLAILGDRVTNRTRALVGSLGVRQLARRPLRYTRTALLLILAMSMGVFAVSYHATWAQSQHDQATYQVGGDVRVTPARGVDAMPGWALDAAYRSIDGVTATLPLARERIRVGRTGGPGEVLAVDPAALPVVVGGSLGSAPSGQLSAAAAGLGEAARRLGEATQPVRALTLPGEPRRIAIEATIRFDEASEFGYNFETGEEFEVPLDPAELASRSTAGLAIAVRDARGIVQRFVVDAAPFTSRGWQFVVPIGTMSALRSEVTERLGGGFSWPLEIVGAELAIHVPSQTQVSAGRIAIDGIAVSESAAGDDWRSVDARAVGEWAVRWSGPGAPGGSVLARTTSGIGLDVEPTGAGSIGSRYEFGEGVGGGDEDVRLAFMPADVAAFADSDIPALVNRTYLEAVAGKPGERILVALPGGSRHIRVLGTLDAFPTTDPLRPLIVTDIRAMALARYAGGMDAQAVAEWWLDVAGPEVQGAPATAAIEAARSGGPLSGATIQTRAATWLRLSTDPIALSTIGALSLGFVVAGLFAIIGLTTSAAVSARQRRTEFALLRALGLSPDQLSGWLWLENASLVLVSIVAGTLLGLVIAWVVLPFITVTQAGATPFPPVVVEVAWHTIAVLEVVSVAALAITLVLLARSLRRAGVGSVLRMGED
jgi:hypothetical protein